MRNEWRGNIWMIIELTIVSIILWFLFTTICTIVNVRMQHAGYDVNDLYGAEIKVVDEDSPYYRHYDSLHSPLTDRDLLMAKLNDNPYVETVGAGSNILTYSYNMYGMYLCHDTVCYHGNLRSVTPDVIMAYKIESQDGKTSSQLADIISKGELIISRPDFMLGNRYYDSSLFKDKDVYWGGDSAIVRHVGAVAYGLRRSDYEPQWGVIYAPLPDEAMPDQMVIRIVHGKDREFVESMTTAEKRAGNVYLSNLQSMESRREIAHSQYNTLIRDYLVCAFFLMIMIFLGFLGTFWFRTQQRVDEIAIRKVNGATRRDIMRRLVSESLMLLAVSTLIAIPVELLAVHYGLLDDLNVTYYHVVTLTTPEIYQSMAMTVGFLALLILAGIWFPASKAMNVSPAQVLKDQ